MPIPNLTFFVPTAPSPFRFCQAGFGHDATKYIVEASLNNVHNIKMTEFELK